MTPQDFESVTTRTNPLVDPALHAWGWEIVVYLFLGGLVAGILVLTGTLERARGRRSGAPALVWMPLVALGLLSLGMLALWLDLAHRFWAWRFYATWRPTSPMSWGAWILVLLYPAAALAWLGSLGESSRATLRRGLPARLRSLFDAAVALSSRRRGAILAWSIGLGVALGIYTGLLLGTVPSRPAWNSALLGPLFLASGISAGAAFLLLTKIEPEDRERLVRWDAYAIAAELVLILLMLGGWATSGTSGRLAASLFFGGPYTAVFWSIVVLAGLVVPLVMDALEWRLHLKSAAIVPVLILCGGLALRWILLSAGQTSSVRGLP
jgi:formate-dependent nitrite reductase membrane component NrfD